MDPSPFSDAFDVIEEQLRSALELLRVVRGEVEGRPVPEEKAVASLTPTDGSELRARTAAGFDDRKARREAERLAQARAMDQAESDL